MASKTFLQRNPYCCFCGGKARTTTENHVPARTIFDGRHWPEGFSFPACFLCNQIAAGDEEIIGFLTRLGPSEQQTEEQAKDMWQRMGTIRDRYPDDFAGMQLTANQKRRRLKEHGIPRPAGVALQDIPVFGMPPRFIQATKNLGTQLACALHYKHTGEIVPPDWQIAIRTFSNVQWNNEAVTAVIRILSNIAGKLERANVDLSDQFDYRYAIATEKTVSAFAGKFRQSFIVTTIASAPPLPVPLEDDVDSGKFFAMPFRHSSES